MRSDRLIPGTILVIIGVVFLLDNFGVINFSWWSFFSLWPILLIMGGVNLVFAHNRSNWATALKIVVLIAGMSILIVDGLTHRSDNWQGWRFHWNRDFDDDHNNNNIDTTDLVDTASGGSIVKSGESSTYRQAYKPGTTSATLNITGGATKYVLNGTTDQLFEATTKDHIMNYTLKGTLDSTNAVVDFDMTTHKHKVAFNWGRKKDSRADIKLNPNPEW